MINSIDFPSFDDWIEFHRLRLDLTWKWINSSSIEFQKAVYTQRKAEYELKELDKPFICRKSWGEYDQ